MQRRKRAAFASAGPGLAGSARWRPPERRDGALRGERAPAMGAPHLRNQAAQIAQACLRGRETKERLLALHPPRKSGLPDLRTERCAFEGKPADPSGAPAPREGLGVASPQNVILRCAAKPRLEG